MDWTRGPAIGRGSSASVYLATTAGGEIFAVKSAGFSSSFLLQKEHLLVSQLCSPYIVKCLGFDATLENNERVYNLHLEYVPGGTLSELIVKQGGSLGEGLIRFYAHQMLLGLDYLHLNGFVHCDIKGQNILIGESGLKIADFGCAKRVESDTCSKQMFAGTPAYMAPEAARGEEQSFAADIWAFGCAVIEMATGSYPWPEMKDPASVLYRIASSGDVPVFPSWFSDEGKDFLSKCLIRDSRKRWTARELLKHAFFDDVMETCGEIRESTRKSPTSVMAQSFWDELEESGSSQAATGVNASSSDSPADRIRDLITENFPLNINSPDWGEDDVWVTVRGDEIEECFRFVNDDSETLIDAEDVTFSGVGEEEIQTSGSIENFNGIVISILFVSRIIILRRILMEFFLLFGSTFLKSFSSFSFSFSFFNIYIYLFIYLSLAMITKS
ncbi:mitogen-activated protein kinase kinase kinase 18-like [Primulina tabacum]|uniref:mitogen-activated protein kinase kinase kinase 18-like n=1 Tax=Primulina tabacum TaxID=48773 RepID=UPI003F597DDF